MLNTDATDAGPDSTPGPNPIPHAKEAAAWVAGQQQLATRLAATAAQLAVWRTEQQRSAVPLHLRLAEARRQYASPEHISSQARKSYDRANQPSYRRPLFADRDAETLRRQSLAEERAALLEARALRAA